MHHDEKLKPQHKRRRGWMKRMFLGLVCFVIVTGILAWAFLPRIAEKVIASMIADADLKHAEFTVREIGWNSAVIENVSMADGVWQLKSSEVKIDYAPFDLIKGQVDQITMSESVCVVDFSLAQSEAEKTEEKKNLSSSDMMRKLPLIVEQIGRIDVPSAMLTLKRKGHAISVTGEFLLQAGGREGLEGIFLSEDFQMKLKLASEKEKVTLSTEVDQIVPDRFLSLLELVMDHDGGILPDGFEMGSANLSGDFFCEADDRMSLKVTGDLTNVSYDGGGKPVQMKSSTVAMSLHQDFSASGYLLLSGGVEMLLLPLDPLAGFVLGSKQDFDARWKTKIVWGSDAAVVTGLINKLDLRGTYDSESIEIDNFQAKLNLVANTFNVDGSFLNDGAEIPFKYSHELSEKDENWKLIGLSEVGPIKHERPLPLLIAASSLFEETDIVGETTTKFEYSIGANDPLQGVLSTKAKDLSISLANGTIKADGVNGEFQFHILPFVSADPDQEDPSFYTFNFVSKNLHLETKSALDFDLEHSGEDPVVFTGKGKLGDVARLEGDVENLTLHGEYVGEKIDLVDTHFNYSLHGEELKAKGGFSFKENEIPFSYRHIKKDINGIWNLDGVFEIKSADLSETIDNAAILIDAIEGVSFTGKIAMRMGFSMGGEKDFDGFLAAAMAGGILTFDDGPVIEGVKGNMLLSSLKTKQTDEFHRVTARKIKAFDTEMENARLDFQMLPNGDISLKNIWMEALGGTVWLDPFVFPGGDTDYKFKVRMKNLNLEKLAALFPDFDGRITGNMDGLLPMQNKDGKFMPQRGGMYLTPGKRAKLIYNSGNKFSEGLQPGSREYEQMKIVEDSLKNMELRVLSIRLFDPRDKDKAVVLKLQGQAPSVPGSPPIILNINGFKPDDDAVDFFDLLLKHRDKLNFGL